MRDVIRVVTSQYADCLLVSGFTDWVTEMTDLMTGDL